MSGSGVIRTAIFTPTEGVASGSASITVADGSYIDAAGNTGSEGTTPTITINTVPTPITISGLALSADTGASATDFITSVAAQTISATLSAQLGIGESLFGSVDNGTTWTNITGKVTGTVISWDGATLSGSSSIKLEVRDVSGNAVTEASHTYQLESTLSGLVQDGYLDHALVWVDANNNGLRDWVDGNSNGKWDTGEGESWTLTDSTGQFAGLVGDGTLRITANPDGGTIDISTGKAFTGSFSAPSGSTVVNPLTTLVVAAGGNSALVKAALGLDPTLDLTTYDPLAESSKSGLDSDALAMAIKVESAAIQLANIMDIAMGVTHGAGGSTTLISESVANALITAAGSGTINIANSTVISNAIVSAAQTVVTNPTALSNITNTIDAIAAAVALVNSKIETVATIATAAAQSGGAIDALNSLTQIVSAQIVAQDTASQAFDAVSQNNNSLITLTPGNVDQQITTATSSVGSIFVNHLPTGAVTITGTSTLGEILVAGNTLHDVDGIGTISYQWQAGGVDINGAVSGSYILAASNISKVITVKAAYTDGAGTHESVISAGTDAVVPPLTPMAHNGGSVMPERYTGPAKGAGGAPLHFQFIGDSINEVMIGTPYNDFINVAGGVDAVDGGAGNDVLDGGTESNFLTGGAGTDIFFSDGRGGITTWSTITDWQAGEQLSVWGWTPGTSRIIAWVQDGAEGYKGLTMHADLNGDGTIDTSVTFTGIVSQAQLPAPLELDGLLWFN